ncbi:uncharacterized protein P884DRAFT_294234 [Thermothelomyces heterothallicus CBS 202.75]|uniref:uncharacterized protein n=1 Tax=Thermothelomyces heterothallicus CBS 202.75 TaxID=1149848 RepID=UPI0037424605
MAKGKPGLSAAFKAIDPALDALFSQSAGAVKTPPKSRYADLLPQKPKTASKGEEDEEDKDNSENEESEASEEELEEESGAESDASMPYEDEDESENEDDSDNEEEDGEVSGEDESEVDGEADASSVDDEAAAAEIMERAVSGDKHQDEGRKRKRKQRDDDEALEADYLERLTNEEKPSVKRRKADTIADNKAVSATTSSPEEDDDDESGDDVPVHESIAADPTAAELEKANRTVFLSNVSVEAIKSRKAKKTLLRHLSSVLDKNADPPQKVESIRFRSTPFQSAGIPKRAAYIKKEVLEATTKSTNAYVVYSTTAASRLAVAQLNGTIVLDRHLRVDSVAHPAPIDHRRCVFVGNLGFVDDETVYNTKIDEEGKEVVVKRKRTKTPMDVEEGLWRVFGEEAGKVESVRVVRDPVTRVGKGFAYVQFYDGNAVESAILLNGKKFPPMLPRELRVSRCKAPHKTARAMEARMSAKLDKKKGGRKASGTDAASYVPKLTAEAQTLAGRASKLLGRFGAAKLTGKPAGPVNKKRQARKERFLNGGGTEGGENGGIKAPEQFVFEGKRASARDGKPRDLKFKKTKSKAAKAKPKASKKKKAKAKAGKAGKAGK